MSAAEYSALPRSQHFLLVFQGLLSSSDCRGSHPLSRRKCRAFLGLSHERSARLSMVVAVIGYLVYDISLALLTRRNIRMWQPSFLNINSVPKSKTRLGLAQRMFSNVFKDICDINSAHRTSTTKTVLTRVPEPSGAPHGNGQV